MPSHKINDGGLKYDHVVAELVVSNGPRALSSAVNQVVYGSEDEPVRVELGDPVQFGDQYLCSVVVYFKKALE